MRLYADMMVLHNGMDCFARKEACRMNQHKSFTRRLLPLAILTLFCSMLFTLIQCQITIGSKQQELTAVREQLTTQQAQNEELIRALADGEDTIIERSAREDGYAKPNERIWVDLSGK